jgi:hypothetical protein
MITRRTALASLVSAALATTGISAQTAARPRKKVLIELFTSQG